MILLEHHAKELLGQNGIPVPAGVMVSSVEEAGAIAIPVVVKAQVPVGGRGKAGGIAFARSQSELRDALGRIVRMSIKGHKVRACRLERPVECARECYLSLSVDAYAGAIRVMLSATGGVDIENSALRNNVLNGLALPDIDSVTACIEALSADLPSSLRFAIRAAGAAIVPVFFEREALLLEINPLFVLEDGSWIAGDAKFVTDDNALPRQDALRAIVESNATLYPEAATKLEQGFDFVVLDPGGDIGLVTTGAGLSMQLVDELIAKGRRPFNFCDIRTGGFKGNPDRLVQVFKWIAQGPGIRSVLMNFFAGMTDLGELAKLLLVALDQVPEIKRVPITARLIGNGLSEAREVIAAAGNPIAIETDLERAIANAIAVSGAKL
jgi:succinyl-CoA synthetase beta subunit